MKKIKILFCSIGLLCMFGCDSKLEEIRPENALSSSVIFSNFTTIEATTVGIYNALQNGNILGGTNQFANDFMADDVNFVGSFTTLQDIRDFDANATNGSIAGIWGGLWNIVRDANNIIVNLDPIEASDVNFTNSANAANFDALKQQFIGEAYFARALAYFTALNTFAQPVQISNGSTLGLPIVTEFFEGNTEAFQQPRSSVNDTHDFIESDLITAISLLPESNGIRADKASARGLLSRLYLYQERWPEAANVANDVINTAGLMLAPDLSFYNSPSSEHVFQIVNLPDDPAGGSDFDTFYNPTSQNGRGDLVITDDLINAYLTEPEDQRYTVLTFDDVDAGNQPGRFTRKYPNGQANDSDPNVVRMAEMHLTRAEANLRGGTTIGATPLEDINAIRDRAGITTPLSSVTLEDILLERRKELAFEGHRRMDLLRNGRNLKPAGTALTAPGAPKTILPLPVAELNGNPNAEQNPSY